MSGSMAGVASPGSADASDGAAESTFIPLSDPDISLAELEAIDQVMRSPRLSSGPTVEAFQAAFALISAAITPWQCQAAPWGFCNVSGSGNWRRT